MLNKMKSAFGGNKKLIAAATPEILEKEIDTFTLGCGSFINISKPLQEALSKKFKRPIIIVDPIQTPFNIAKVLV